MGMLLEPVSGAQLLQAVRKLVSGDA